MALNIPNYTELQNPLLKGIDTGSTLFSRLMQPVLEREKLKQQAEQFAQNMELRKQASARAGANSDINRQILEQQLLKLQHSNDPNYELEQLQSMIQAFGSNPTGQEDAGQMPNNVPESFLPSITQAPSSNPTEELPTLITDLPQEQVKNSNGIDMEAIKKNPLLRSWFKKHYGVDPAAGSGHTLHGAARDAADLEILRKEVGDNSPVYQNALAAYESTLSARKDLRDLRERTKQGLKPGEKEFFDPESGTPLGKEIPLTAKERESEEGNILFNTLYPLVYKGAAPFSGEGSISRLENAAINYKTDPQARKLFDDFLLAEKMLAAATVNEASTLKAGRTNRTYNMLKESLDAQDIPILVKKLIKQYQIPASAQLKAGMRYQKELSDARHKARKGTPATQKLFYNPELQAKYEEHKNEGLPPKKENGSVIVIDPNGKRFETTEENAKHLPKGWSHG
jgi:hypothetical protein